MNDGSGTRDVERHPFPGRDLAFRVAGTADREWFFKSGKQTAEDIANGLSVAGVRLQDCARILDFGCGCGRVLLWLKDVAGSTELYGTDIDSTAIEWARGHIPHVTFTVNNGLPPTEFPDAFFDFVYSQSVFTHLDEAYQDAWLAELQRIVKPGGRLLLSVNGEHSFGHFESTRRKDGTDSSALRALRDMKGILYIADDQWTGGPFPDFYHSTFHTAAYVLAHWSRYFKIRAYIPQGSIAFQDFVLLDRLDPAALEDIPRGHSLGTNETTLSVAQVLARGPRVDYPGRLGGFWTFAWKVLKRVLRQHSKHEHDVHVAMLAALRGLNKTDEELLEAIRRQEERVSRLEKQQIR